MQRPAGSDGIASYEGYCADLVALLANKLGFNYTINLVKDGRYGQLQSDGTYNGMIGEIIRGASIVTVHDFCTGKSTR
jgi:glutamate receptor, ionotropic, invertebrate